MTNKELIRIREEKKLGKKEFAALLGITPMLLGRYEKGSIVIPENVAEKLKEVENTAAAVKGAADDKIVAEKIEAKKTVRKAGRTAKKAVEDAAAIAREAADDKAVAEEIEVKKTVRKNARRKKEAVDVVVEETKKTKRRVSLDIVIKSPMGGAISADEIAKKVPKNTSAVYVRVDENKLYWVKGDYTGAVDIWE